MATSITTREEGREAIDHNTKTLTLTQFQELQALAHKKFESFKDAIQNITREQALRALITTVALWGGANQSLANEDPSNENIKIETLLKNIEKPGFMRALQEKYSNEINARMFTANVSKCNPILAEHKPLQEQHECVNGLIIEHALALKEIELTVQSLEEGRTHSLKNTFVTFAYANKLVNWINSIHESLQKKEEAQ